MAFLAISFCHDHLLPLLTEGGDMIRGVPIEVEDMKDELEKIQAFIHDAFSLVAPEELYAHDEIKNGVKQLTESAFRMEDAIDGYMILEEQQPPDPGCAALFCVAHFIKTMILRHQMKCDFLDCKSRVGKIYEMNERNGFPIGSSLEQGPSSSRGNQNPQLQYLDMAPFFMDEADIVGFEAPSCKLIDWLLNERRECTVISVVGMVGIGKTTLAKKVFNSRVVLKHFECRVWMTFSESYTIDELLAEMLRKLYKQIRGDPPQNMFKMDRQSLIGEVRNCLQQRRYVVVFDNVWNINDWDAIKYAVIDNKNGSRILITTRNMNVVVNCERSFHVELHEMQPLTLEDSLMLFIKKAFKGNCPADLVDISFEIVKKCKCLPLAIVTIGSVLYGKKKNAPAWERSIQNPSSEIMQSLDVYVITRRFGFDYDNLPSFLKPFLLYFTIYPEDYEVNSKRLIRQWIAEGFIKQETRRTLEEAAEEYLTELISRCLVQVSSVSIDGKVKGCCVHDLFRAMLRKKAEDLSFCKFIGEDDSWVLTGIIRRLSIATTTANYSMGSIESSHVRSLLFFTEDELPEYLVRTIPTKYKLLKVLDFESAKSCAVFENLENLIYLKYLSFRNTEIRSLPKSIGKLLNLETLDVRGTAVTEMPKEISKLRKLRHLMGNKMSLNGGIGGMESLQTLSGVRIDVDGIGLTRELEKLRQLRKLSLFDVKEEQGPALCSSINEMPHLEKLYIETKSKDAAIDLNFSTNPSMLRKLRLQARLNKLPEWIPELDNLVELSLSYSQLTDDPLKSLKGLPNLLVLNLASHSYEGECLHFEEGGFRRLKELGLRYLHRLNSIIIDKGALPSLKELTLMNIPELKKVPSGIFYLENLLVFNAHFMPTEFEEIMKIEGIRLPVV